jgi:hypothetical protein
MSYYSRFPLISSCEFRSQIADYFQQLVGQKMSREPLVLLDEDVLPVAEEATNLFPFLKCFEQ